MNYAPYSEYDIHLLFSEIREISDKPYMMHAAFLLSCLYEAYTPNDDEEEQEFSNPENAWGWKIPKKVLESIIKNANEQFIYASEHGLQIDIWDKGYSIRKAKGYDPIRLKDIFAFPVINDDYIVCKEGVMNLSENIETKTYDNAKEEYHDNKSYLRKVIMIAEDDANDGWNHLTDIEVTVYLWALFYLKHKTNNETSFRHRYKHDLYTTSEEDRSCWNHDAQQNMIPNGLYTFSANNVRAWNQQHNQTSIIDKVNNNDADDYWFNVVAKRVH